MQKNSVQLRISLSQDLKLVSRKILFLKFKLKKDFGRTTSKAITTQLRNSEPGETGETGYRELDSRAGSESRLSRNSTRGWNRSFPTIDQTTGSCFLFKQPEHGNPRVALFSSLPIGSEPDQSNDRIDAIVDSSGPFKFDRVEGLRDESENCLETSLTFSISQS